jgi:heme/copper-type cytochrome/quinol oxidase subunit 2
MYVQQATELFYMGLLVTFVAFMAVFIWVTSRIPPRKAGVEGAEPKGMERSEKKWLVILLVIALIGNALLLSTVVPSVRTAVWGEATPAMTVYVTIRDYNFTFPEMPVNLTAGQAVEFVVTSSDVTYGFGVFRPDGTMVFQMQVVPGYENRIIWIFDEPDSYTVRSTEYSGPHHSEMVVPGAIVVR